MIYVLLLVHGLSAVLLLGALTHQIIELFWRANGPRTAFVAAVRGVRTGTYANAVTGLFVLTFIVGAIIYPDFRVDVRTIWDVEWPAATGSFEIKEHYGAIGLGMLPAYWAVWRLAASEALDEPRLRRARLALTLLLALIVWSDFVLGHILNNVKGLS